MGMMCVIRQVDLESMMVELLCDSKSLDYVLLETEGHEQEQLPRRDILSCFYGLFKKSPTSMPNKQQGDMLDYSRP